VAVPIPAAAEMPLNDLNEILEKSLREAEEMKICGRDLTPFLLARMAELSDGTTLRANIALLKNNAGVAARIANALN